jgi:RimJ/RimL family protein N-acetyltransferase
MLETKRGRLVRPAPGHFEGLAAIESDAEVVARTGLRLPKSREETASRLQDQIAREAERAPLGVWIAELADASFAGWFMLLPMEFSGPELGYMLARSAWGKGYATEFAARLLEYGRSAGFREFYARADADHRTSIRVLEKLGFERKEVRRGRDPKLGREVETAVFLFRAP